MGAIPPAGEVDKPPYLAAISCICHASMSCICHATLSRICSVAISRICHASLSCICHATLSRICPAAISCPPYLSSWLRGHISSSLFVLMTTRPYLVRALITAWDQYDWPSNPPTDLPAELNSRSSLGCREGSDNSINENPAVSGAKSQTFLLGFGISTKSQECKCKPQYIRKLGEQKLS